MLSVVAAKTDENIIDEPTYPKYKKGGWIANPKSCNIGLKPSPSILGKNSLVNGLDVNKIKLMNAEAIRPWQDNTRDINFKGSLFPNKATAAL